MKISKSKDNIVSKRARSSPVYNKVYELVSKIPKGKVLTYGLVSNLINSRLSAQGVGWALQALPLATTKEKKYSCSNVPWHRVVNSRGQLSTGKNPNIPPELQKRLLEQEGIKFNAENALDLDKHLWHKGLIELAN